MRVEILERGPMNSPGLVERPDTQSLMIPINKSKESKPKFPAKKVSKKSNLDENESHKVEDSKNGGIKKGGRKKEGNLLAV